MTHKIIVVGIGPGDSAYLLPKAQKIIDNARILVGGRRALADYSRSGARECAIGADIPSVLSFIRESLAEDDVVVMVSGDPDVVPGISSLQLAFARLALPWHSARLLSFHGREPMETELFRAPEAVLGMLTDGRNNSQTIAARLLSCGWRENDRMYVCTRLSYEDEEIIEMTLGAAKADTGIGHGVIIVCAHEENV